MVRVTEPKKGVMIAKAQAAKTVALLGQARQQLEEFRVCLTDVERRLGDLRCHLEKALEQGR